MTTMQVGMIPARVVRGFTVVTGGGGSGGREPRDIGVPASALTNDARDAVGSDVSGIKSLLGNKYRASNEYSVSKHCFD